MSVNKEKDLESDNRSGRLLDLSIFPIIVIGGEPCR